MDRVECVVVGAGVVGLAIARRLAQAGLEVIVLEAAEGIGTVTSSRNSEVIHAGIYHAAGSLMARMCVNGKRALYEYCRDHGIPHRNCRKLIVATPVAGYVGCSHAIPKINFTARLKEIKCPILVIVGADDPGTPVSMAKEIHDNAPGSKLVVLPQAAHLSNIEQPEGFTKALRGLLGG